MEHFKGQMSCVELAEEFPTSGGVGESHLSHSDRLHMGSRVIGRLSQERGAS